METSHELYAHKMEAQLREWGARLDQLKAKADKASIEAKIEMRKHVDEMATMTETAKKHLADFKASSADSWKDVKQDVENGWAHLTANLEAFWTKVSKD